MATWLRVDQPWWLLAAAAAAVPILLAMRSSRGGRPGGSHGKRPPAWAVGLQCLAVLLAALALSRPAVRTSGKSRLPWLILRDVSASTRGQDSNCSAWPADLPHRTAEFAEDILRGGAGALAGGEEVGLAPARTLIRPPLQLALGRSAELAGAVVVSDGRWHDERWEDAAEGLRRSGLPLLVVPLDNPPQDARITEFRAARRGGVSATGNSGVLLRVTAAGNSPLKRTFTVRREGEAKPLLAKEIQLLPGESFTASVTDDPGAAAAQGLLTYRAELRPSDDFPENDSASATLLPEKPKLAVICEEASPEVNALLRIAGKGMGGGGWFGPLTPRAARELMPYSAIVLIDPNGGLLDAAQRAALARYVREGGGLLIVGTGPSDSAQDRQDPLNRVAALVPNPYERRPLRVVVVLDSSGSMAEAGTAAGGRRKYDLAAESVAGLRSHLTPRDSLAVITFSDSARRVYDSGAKPAPTGGPAGPDFTALREAMAKVQPGGPTVIAPALEEATAVAVPAGAEGLVIVVSDLAAKPFDENKMAERFRRRRYSLAIVEVRSASPTSIPPPDEGPSPERPSLATLAKLMDVTPVPQEDLSRLAEVFGRFIRQARGEVVRRGTFRLAAPGAIFGRDASGLPPVEAYILSAPQEGAAVLASVGEDPVIARRAVGPGRVVSIALPISKAQNAAWMDPNGFSELLDQAIVWAIRPWGAPGYSGELRRAGEHVRLAIEATEETVDSILGRPLGTPLNLLKLTARVAPLGSDAPPREVPLEQVAPGRYEATVAEAGGPLVVQVVDPEGLPLWRGVWEEPCAEEFAAVGPNWANLQRLAALGGGKIVPMNSLRAAGREVLRGEYSPVWAALLAAAVALMLLEWAAVRIVRR